MTDGRMCLVIVPYMCIVCSVWITVADGFGTDPEFGRSACLHLYPSGHEVEPQASASPYAVTVSGSSYNPGDMLLVTISSRDNVPFRGFILQARSVEDPEQKVGDFIPNDEAKINCVVEGYGGKTVTHVDPSEKVSISVTWIAPAQPSGAVQFRATIVQTFDIYWMDIASDVINGPKSIIHQTVMATNTQRPSTVRTPEKKQIQSQIQPSISYLDLSACGMTKGCYRSPEDCTDSCEYILTWTHNDTNMVHFELQGTMNDGQLYIAMALSHDLFMGDDSVIDCIYDDDVTSVIIQQSYNMPDDKENNVITNPIIGLVPDSLVGYYGDGLLTCRFTRYVKPPTDDAVDKKSFCLDGDYHISLAKGPVTNGVKGYHGESQVVSNVKVNLATGALVNIGGTSGYPLIKAHGILMILSWVVCASFAVLMPRYCKKAWPGKKIAGIPVWFRLHQFFMYTSLLLSVAGFIVIFINARGYCYYEQLPQKAHPPLGITTTILLILNPIMAAFRPAPTSSKRPIFNMLHFLVGLSAHVLSVVTLYIGVYMTKAAMPIWSVKIMGAYVVWHIVIEIVLTINKHCCSKPDAKTSSYVMKQADDKEAAPAAPASHNVSRVNTVVPILHLVGVIALSLALIIPLATA